MALLNLGKLQEPEGYSNASKHDFKSTYVSGGIGTQDRNCDGCDSNRRIRIIHGLVRTDSHKVSRYTGANHMTDAGGASGRRSSWE